MPGGSGLPVRRDRRRMTAIRPGLVPPPDGRLAVPGPRRRGALPAVRPLPAPALVLQVRDELRGQAERYRALRGEDDRLACLWQPPRGHVEAFPNLVDAGDAVLHLLHAEGGDLLLVLVIL